MAEARKKVGKKKADNGGLKVQYEKVADLEPYHRNARSHSDQQINQIAESIERYGFNNPILLDGGNGVVAGHGRLLAAIQLGLAEVPVVRLQHLTDAQKRAYIVADNKLALNASWDEEMLSAELIDLSDLDEIDLSTLGFDQIELDALLGVVQPAFTGAVPADTYKEQYGVIVVCQDEEEQEATYLAIKDLGYECRVVAT